MSTQHGNDTPGEKSSVTAEVDGFFRRAAASGPQSRWGHISGVCQFNIEGAGTWRATIKKDVMTVTRGEGDGTLPTCTISCSADVFLRLERREGRLNIYAAILQEVLTISGDIPFAYAVMGGFIMDPAQALAR